MPSTERMHEEVLQSTDVFIFLVMEHLSKRYFRAKILVKAAETMTWQMS